MPDYAISPKAADDLREIVGYIEAQNPGRGIAYVEELEKAFSLYAVSPMIGRARPEIADGIRSFPFGNYVVFYRLQDHEFVIVRVLHGRRDILRAF